ncbi:glycine zipper 2TM domain-containing protein [Massilia sp. 9096]|uniref:glycine zipper 2TM domain-containing protein n=1 Tax=Massilia sp. 9096 TaxID=1500894 RepID=UPI000564DB88|nr:glycine zipper 2TM domain-containing protein [Massilia sp. 9096]
METTKTTNRIHPLMAAAAVSVIVVSLAGTAAITGMLPSSHGAPEAPVATAQAVPGNATLAQAALPGAPVSYTPAMQPVQAAYAQPAQLAQAQPMPVNYAQPVASVQPAPVVIEKTVIKEVPVPAKPVHRTVHHTSYARNDAPAYYEPAPAQPNYVAIGTGAVVGGLIGNQVGGGNGRKLATVAGIIGGGFLGNQIANQGR